MASTSPIAPLATDIKCRFCQRMFTEPKLLLCGHHLCRACLLTLLKTHQDDAQCPHCQTSIADPDSGLLRTDTPEDLADDLPTDAYIEELTEVSKILSTQQFCCVCENVSATSICLTCGDTLCSSCKKAHTKLSALKLHRVEDLSRLRPETLAAYRTITCSVHPGEAPKLFCSTHGVSICRICAESLHEACADVDDLEEKVEEAIDDLEELVVTLSNGEDDLADAIERLNQHLTESEQVLKAALVKIDETYDHLEASIKDSRRLQKDRMVNSFSDVKRAVHDGKKYLFGRQRRLTSHRLAASRVQSLKNYDPVHVMVPVLEERAHDFDYSTTLPADTKPIHTLSFTIDPQAVSMIDTALADLGQISAVPAESFAEQLPVLRFHEVHGQNIVLSEEGQTAGRAMESRGDNGIVLSADPMQFNVLYEVVVDRWADTYEQGSMCVGVVTQNPSTVSLPSWSGHLKSSSVIVRKNWVKNCVTGTREASKIGLSLGSLMEDSRVGVLLDSARALHLYVDGEDQGVVARDMPRPCYALFDVCDDAAQVTALPVTRIPMHPQKTFSVEKLSDPSLRETTM